MSAVPSNILHRMLRRVVVVHPHEIRALLWSFAYFFCVLAAYYILRPVRDEMGVLAGVHKLPWFFFTVFLTMLAVVPLFGWAASCLTIRRLLPTIYLFFIVNLIGFFIALRTGLTMTALAPVFFVWVSVFNLFIVSVFWSFMADVFSTEGARRLFGFISAGGSLGAISGPLFTATAVKGLGVASLLLVSAALLLAAVGCILALLAWFQEQHGEDLGAKHLLSSQTSSDPPPSLWVGIIRITQSTYLQAICVYLVCYSILSTFLYSQQTILVPQVVPNSEDRLQLFASFDFAVNVLTVCIQMFATGRLLTFFGVTAMLVILPLLNILGFGIFGMVTILPVLIGFGILRRAGEFSITKPTRETLFTVVPRVEKYQAKNVIDTVVHRAGDMTGTWVGSALHAFGMSISQMSFAAIPIALVWFFTGRFLGRRHEMILEKQKTEKKH
ncbi:MAG: MFS transporter [Nitrospirales bacterium]|nr:MAG: MFS transporter [Nitrospirales bacterium]